MPKQPTGAVATPHPAAAAAGRDLLLSGGNAVDAAVGAMLVCCIATPGMVGLGGYGGSLVAFLADQQATVAIDFDSRAPLAYRPDVYPDRASFETGYLSITVPAVVAGLDLALSRLGKLSWAAVSAPAIALAESGVPVTAELRKTLDGWWRKADALSRRALFAADALPEVGSLWSQPDLARLLRQLATDGPATFYHGDIPQMIVRQVQAHGGILAEEDFEHYRPAVVEPLAVDYRGYRVLTPPPPSGGITSLQILKTLEQFDVAGLRPWGAEYFHLVAEAAKLAWRDRANLGDPAAMPHTVNIVSADSAGNLVSMTATHGYLYGSSVVIDGLGLVMNHGMSRFDSAGPNAAAPGKRMMHNMSPTILLRNGRAFAAVGLPGGPKIVTVTAQLVVSLVDFGASPAAAVSAGRIHAEGNEPVAVSSAVPDAVIDKLRALGHAVRRGQDIGGPPGEIGGMANVVVIADGTPTAASQAGPDSATNLAEPEA